MIRSRRRQTKFERQQIPCHRHQHLLYTSHTAALTIENEPFYLEFLSNSYAHYCSPTFATHHARSVAMAAAATHVRDTHKTVSGSALVHSWVSSLAREFFSPETHSLLKRESNGPICDIKPQVGQGSKSTATIECLVLMLYTICF